ncbi:MAG: class I SAM-dependent methyltransferase [Sphingomicrobium sp.]
MPSPEQSIAEAIRSYYNNPQTLRKFSLWGPDSKRPGVTAAHMGLDDVEQFHKDVLRRPIEYLRHKRAIGRMTRRIIAESSVADGHRVLDAGCGTGAVSFPIAEENPRAQVYGISLSHSQLEAARSYQQSAGIRNIHFSEQNYTQTAFAEASLDRVIFVESLCHALDKRAAIVEASRVLKPGGKLIIFDAMYANTPTAEQQSLCDALGSNDGIAMPDLPTFEQLTGFITDAGMKTEYLFNLTTRVMASLRLIANGYIGALQEARAEPSPVIDSYLAWYLLTEQNALGYGIVRAVK